MGADHVISTQESEWEQQLQQIAKELNSKIFFDCVGGNLPGKILSLLPNGAVLYNFGNLEIKKLGVDSSSLIFKNKAVPQHCSLPEEIIAIRSPNSSASSI